MKGPLGYVDDYFQITRRNSTFLTEIRAGITLFITSVYILALNPLILSGAGMNKEDVLLATAISTGVGTAFMGLVANYPWVVSVQLGTNVYFVYNVVRPFTNVDNCAKLGLPVPTTKTNGQAGCTDYEIGYKKVLAATFIEGVIFLGIAILGLRTSLMGLFPRVVLMAGACGIGIFIAFVGMRQMGVTVANNPPNLIQFNSKKFNYCTYDDGYVNCPWLSLAGLVVTGILTVYMINGSLLIGIFFTTFITWARFNDTAPDFKDVPKFHDSAFALDFNWSGQVGKLIGATITFLYLDFIGACITFYSMGKMMDIVEPETGSIPNSNKAFAADAIATMVGGLLGTSCLTTYVESAAAVKEGGRTGLTAVICSILFFLMCFLSPIFAGPIPDIAQGPILVIIGVLIFNDAVGDIDWGNLTDAVSAFITMIVMPFTNNIAYGAIAGFGSIIILRGVTYQLFPFQKSWPGYAMCTAWLETQSKKSMKLHLDGPEEDHLGEAGKKVDEADVL